MVTVSNQTITFQVQELADKLCHASEGKPTGYWQLQLNAQPAIDPPLLWYLALSQKGIIFSGVGQLDWLGFLEILQRYIPRLRTRNVQQQIEAIKQALMAEQRTSPLILSSQMVAKRLVDYSEITQALRLQTLNDFDTYLFDYAGQAQFLPDSQLLSWPVCSSLALDRLVAEAKQRRHQWQKLEPLVPSRDSIPQLDLEAIEYQRLAVGEKQKLQQLTSQGKTLREIADYYGKDALEIAKTFARLGKQGLVTFPGTDKNNSSSLPAPKIFIVDDSPVILKNFKTVVTNLGYQVSGCDDALKAVSALLTVKPAAIFVDLNMPGMSGFQLIKQIRLQPELASVPLIILTAEKSMSNQMRAKWSKAQFLSKPLDKQEMPTFYSQLRSLLQEIVPLFSRDAPPHPSLSDPS